MLLVSVFPDSGRFSLNHSKNQVAFSSRGCPDARRTFALYAIPSGESPRVALPPYPRSLAWPVPEIVLTRLDPPIALLGLVRLW
jgi:hypothetical protein